MTRFSLVENTAGLASSDEYTPFVRIYADASCIRNGSIDSAAGCGAVILDQNRLEIKLISNYIGNATNQQAEIVACTRALEQLRRCCRVEIVSDSRYVIDTMTGRNRMRTNRPFWTRLVQACYGHHISWRWVKGHSGVPFQEVADRLARASAKLCSDMSEEDVEKLSALISDSNGQFSLSNFEGELETIVSKYRMRDDSFVPVPRLNNYESLPSAFSA